MLGLSLDCSDDRGKVLNLNGVCLRLLRMLEGQAEIFKGTVLVLITKAQDGALQPEGAEVEKLDGALGGHAGDHDESLSPGRYPEG